MFKALKGREESKVVNITKVLPLKMKTYGHRHRSLKINSKNSSLRMMIFDIDAKLYLNMILIIIAISIIISLIIIIATPKIIVFYLKNIFQTVQMNLYSPLSLRAILIDGKIASWGL